MVDGMEASRRGIIAAWQQTCGMTGGSVGTATGGLLITFMGWRSVFYLAMGPVTLLWLLSFCVLPQDKAMSRAELSNKLQSFDKVGTLLFVVFSGAALLVLNRGNDLGWDSNLVMTCAAIAAVSLPLLVLVERAADHPVLPFSLILADPIATKCLILGAGTWTSYQGSTKRISRHTHATAAAALLLFAITHCSIVLDTHLVTSQHECSFGRHS